MKKIDYSDFLSLSFAADPPKLKSLLKNNNQYVGLAINLRPSTSSGGGSDHVPFAQKKIPWVAFMAAMTEDYHQPSDSVARVSKKMMQKVIRLVYLMAFSLGN